MHTERLGPLEPHAYAHQNHMHKQQRSLVPLESHAYAHQKWSLVRRPTAYAWPLPLAPHAPRAYAHQKWSLVRRPTAVVCEHTHVAGTHQGVSCILALFRVAKWEWPQT